MASLLALICLYDIVKSEIINHSTMENLSVDQGNYTQFRISGFGYGDDQLEDDLAQVRLELSFYTNPTNKIRPSLNNNKIFDIFVFSKKSDYLCYIEAVNLLYEERIKKSCPFLGDPQTMRRDVTRMNISDQTFLLKN